ncbi:carbohydrate-binding protein [Paenibacillus larvae]|uniref:carbohydrate-binding protein n=1 Tax=Paenibacillus larvae TaxID=1464 RepID=UPI001EEE7EF7|nr:carbohydrate-binding protein [Paenibacillus larvae]
MKLHRRKGLALLLIIVLLFAMVPMTALGGTSDWTPNTAYKAGDVVTYQGSTYKCIQPHTSLKGWEPPNVPALWQLQQGGGTPTPVPTPTPSPTVPPDTQPPTAPAMGFTPYNATQDEFKADIAYLQSQGKKVVISIGGANGAVELTSEQARNNFANSMSAIIQTYGFDGIDIDLEGSSLSLNPGDTDFKNPTSPKIKYLVSATQEIIGKFRERLYFVHGPGNRLCARRLCQLRGCMGSLFAGYIRIQGQTYVSACTALQLRADRSARRPELLAGYS